MRTVCALSGKTDEAFALLEKYRFEGPETFANFTSLIHDPRFEKIVGRHDGKNADSYWFPTLDATDCFGDGLPWDRKKRKSSLSQYDRVASTTGASAVLRKDLSGLVHDSALISVCCVRTVSTRAVEGPGIILLETEDGRGVRLPALDSFDRYFGDLAQSMLEPRPPWATAIEGAMTLLGKLNVRVDAMVLTAQQCDRIAGRLLVRRGQSSAAVDIDAFGGTAAALQAHSPILIAEPLANELCIRGKIGRPLSTAGAIRKLRSAGGTGASENA